jgi:dienelactone hydrolase
VLLAVAALGCLIHESAQAAVVEDVITAPVSLKTRFGDLQYDIVATVFYDDERAASPYVVVNHGRTGDEEKREGVGWVRFPKISHYLVSLGFTVLVPTRIGYGVTGGPDVERNGTCRQSNYAAGFAVAADQVEAVLRRVNKLPSVDLSRGLVIGVSFGGATAIALTTRNLPGLAGAVNFSGGNGGRPKTDPGHPCSPDQLGEVLSGYGAASKVPSLWLYSPNDRYWGPRLPRQWFAGFVKGGGKAQFVELPPFGEDGHASFIRNQPAWKPSFETFVRELGFNDTTPQAAR